MLISPLPQFLCAGSLKELAFFLIPSYLQQLFPVFTALFKNGKDREDKEGKKKVMGRDGEQGRDRQSRDSPPSPMAHEHSQ